MPLDSPTADAPYRNYLFVYFLSVLPFLLALFLQVSFLWNAGEILSYSKIVKIQADRDALYGAALSGWSFFGYKLALADARSHDVLILGSSRMMEYRQEGFRSAMVNAGGAMNYLNEGLLFLKAYLPKHQPKAILLGLDFWWFNDAAPQLEDFSPYHTDETEITRAKIVDPWDWIRRKKISFASYLGILAGRRTSNPSTQMNAIGTTALESSEGFRKDGSYYYARHYMGNESGNELDFHFSRTFEKIEKAKSRFDHGKEVSSKQWGIFLEILDLCKKYGVPVVLYLPPMAHPVFEKLREMKSEYGFVDELDRRLHSVSSDYYDFRDEASFGGQDCEFIDGYHGGEVTQDRILLAIIKQNPASAISPFIDREKLTQLTHRFAGKALADEYLGKSTLKEIDFLKLGCKKSVQE